ncbi:hypothetical protein H0H93_008163 [Arthromyces matolae]|nr:hypothetical protein H0H93_008163 [Arthromyces matolae]
MPKAKAVKTKTKNKATKKAKGVRNGDSLGRKSWVKGSKLVYFDARKDEFLEAQQAGTIAAGEFYHKMSRMLLLRWGWDLPDGADGPVIRDITDEEAAQEWTWEGVDDATVITRNWRFKKLKTNVGQWFRHRFRHVNEKEAVKTFLESLPDVNAPKPRKQLAINVYGKQFLSDARQDEWKKHWHEVKDTMPEGMRLATWNEFLRLKFKEEPQELQDDVEKEVERAYEEEKAAYEKGTWTEPDTAEGYVEAMKESASYLCPIADAIGRRLGVYVTIMMCGPRGDGKIGVHSIHSNTDAGRTNKIWPQWDAEGFGVAEKSLMAYGKDFFTLDDREKRKIRRIDPLEKVEPLVDDSNDVNGSDSNNKVTSHELVPTPTSTVVPTPTSTHAPALNAPTTIATPSATGIQTSDTQSNANVIIPAPILAATTTGNAIIPAAIQTTITNGNKIIPATNSIGRNDIPIDPILLNNDSPATTGVATNNGNVTGSSLNTSSSSEPQSPPDSFPTPPGAADGITRSQADLVTPQIARPPAMSTPTETSTATPALTPTSTPTEISTVTPALMPALPQSVDTFIFPEGLVAGGLSKWESLVPIDNIGLRNALGFFMGKTWGDEWSRCVTAFFEFEQSRGFPREDGRLANDSRPAEIGQWINQRRRWVDREICDDFSSNWWTWWRGLNENDDDNDGPNLKKLGKCGANGLVLVLTGLSWWGTKAGHGGRGLSDGDSWLNAIRNVTKVLILLRAKYLQEREDQDDDDDDEGDDDEEEGEEEEDDDDDDDTGSKRQTRSSAKDAAGRPTKKQRCA